MQVQVRSASGRQIVNLPKEATLSDLRDVLSKLEGFEGLITDTTPVTIAEHTQRRDEATAEAANEGELKFLSNGGWVVDLMQFASKRIQKKDMSIVVRPDIF